MSTISGESAKEINLFPTSVWIFPPASEEELKTTELLTAALNLYRNPGTATSPSRSARHGWRLNSPHELEPFHPAFTYIEGLLTQTAKRLGLDSGKREFDSWLYILEPGGYHVIHQHAPNLLSGILYLSDCIDTAQLILRDPRPARLCTPSSQSGPSEVPVSSAMGSAIVFPGWLEHWVEENESDQPLAYISFNMGRAKH